MHQLFAALAVSALAAAAYAHEEHHKTETKHDHAGPAETAFGRSADPKKATRTILVEMSDSYRFTPAEITVQQGEIVRFVAVNAGAEMHEMVLGTMQELREHAEMMKKEKPGAKMDHHSEPYIAHVAPGNSGVIAWQFTKAGEFYYGCLVDDHFERGMIGKVVVVARASDASHEHHQHSPASDGMRGALGPYPITREGSGTSWLPDAGPHTGMHAQLGEWSTMTHGFANLIYDRQGGPRGASKTFSTSMLMLMGQREAGGDALGARGMVSLDPLMGKEGYPLLLQSGETANGQPLVDRQHPHDLFMELALSYSRRLSQASSAFIYAGLPGEPALGPPAFMHRFSGEDNPEAPISHHWLDSTHITYGVVTLGYILGGVKLEGSVFRGREPDEDRYDIETGKLDSWSTRLSWNPTRQWALQASYGRLKSPEALHAEADVDRTTASAIYQTERTQTTLAWGRNSPRGGHGHAHATNAYLLESAYKTDPHTVFARVEYAEKDELADDEEIHRVGKLSLGYVYDIPAGQHYKVGFGGLVSRYRIPSELKDEYGSPTSFMIFARIKLK